MSRVNAKIVLLLILASVRVYGQGQALRDSLNVYVPSPRGHAIKLNSLIPSSGWITVDTTGTTWTVTVGVHSYTIGIPSSRIGMLDRANTWTAPNIFGSLTVNAEPSRNIALNDTITSTIGLLSGNWNVGGTLNGYTLGSMSAVDSTKYHGGAGITTLGTITTGVWNGTSVDTTHTDAASKIVGAVGITATKASKDYTIKADTASVLASKSFLANQYRPKFGSGTSSQYRRGDKTWQTLNQAAVAGLTTTDSPTLAGATLTKGINLEGAPNPLAAPSYFNINSFPITAYFAQGMMGFYATGFSELRAFLFNAYLKATPGGANTWLFTSGNTAFSNNGNINSYSAGAMAFQSNVGEFSFRITSPEPNGSGHDSDIVWPSSSFSIARSGITAGTWLATSIETTYTNAVSKITTGWGITATKSSKDYQLSIDPSISGSAAIGAGDSIRVTVTGLTSATGSAVVGYKRAGPVTAIVADTIATYNITAANTLTLFGKFGWRVSYMVGKK